MQNLLLRLLDGPEGRKSCVDRGNAIEDWGEFMLGPIRLEQLITTERANVRMCTKVVSLESRALIHKTDPLV